ncbi:MAG: DUF975 family protein [Clostridia bacterium]
MVSSDFRKDARDKLFGKWGKVVLISLAYFVLFYVISLLEKHTSGFANTVVSILTLLIEIPLGFGLVVCFVKLFNGENVKWFDFFSFGFDNFGKSWGIALRTALKLLLPIILFVVSIALIVAGTTLSAGSALFAGTVSSSSIVMIIIGCIVYVISFIWLIVKSYYYELTYMIAAENPEMSSKDVVLRSKELMQNNRLKLFCLEFSFIGWAILAVLSLGIGMLWLAPYMQFAKISFYKNLIKE